MQYAKLTLLAIPAATLVFILLLLSAVLDTTEGAQIDSYTVWYTSVDSAGIDSLAQSIDWSK